MTVMTTNHADRTTGMNVLSPHSGNQISDVLLGQINQANALIESAIGADSSLYARLLTLRNRLRDQRLQIAVLGQFKRGKSTFINALLGEPLLPTAVVPLTAIATFIAWSLKPLIHVHFLDRRLPERFTPVQTNDVRAILARFVTEEQNPKNTRGVERVELFYPAAILAGGAVLIDTPGIGSTLIHNTEAALGVIPECDAALFIVSADPPLTEAELEYLRRLKPKAGRMFFVVNKIDYLTADEQRTIIGFLRKVLGEHSLADGDGQIFGVSARSGLGARQARDHDGWQNSGMAAFEDHLLSYLSNEKMLSLHEAVRQKAVDIIAQACGDLELRVKALTMPLDQLERKSSEFEETLRSIATQRLTISDLLSGERRRLAEDLEAQADTLREEARRKMVRLIDDALTHTDATWQAQAKSAVATELEELFSAAARRFADSFSSLANDTLNGHRHSVDALIEQVRRTAATTFDVAFVPEGDAEAFRLTQEPYWVTERIATRLIPDFQRLTDRFLPRGSRRRRLRARIIEETNELIIRNTESLRWAILRGLDETFRAATTQFEERLNDAIATTRGVIEEVLARRRDRAYLNEPVLNRLNQSRQALTAARAAIVALNPRPAGH